MLQTQRVVVVAAVILVFFILLLQCVNFINYPHDVKPIFESFTSAGPTRPDDCLCLPGYVPSKTKSDKVISGLVVHHKKKMWTLYFLPSGSRTAYWIPSCTMEGVSHNFCSDPMIRLLSTQEWDSMIDSFDKTLTRAIWDDIHKTTTTSAFFCQRLTDSSDTKACTVLSK